MFPYGHKNTIILWHILADASNPFMHVRYDSKCEYVTFKNYLSFDVLAYCLWSRTKMKAIWSYWPATVRVMVWCSHLSLPSGIWILPKNDANVLGFECFFCDLGLMNTTSEYHYWYLQYYCDNRSNDPAHVMQTRATWPNSVHRYGKLWHNQKRKKKIICISHGYIVIINWLLNTWQNTGDQYAGARENMSDINFISARLR